MSEQHESHARGDTMMEVKLDRRGRERVLAMLRHLTNRAMELNDGPFRSGVECAIEEAVAYLKDIEGMDLGKV